MAVTEQTKRTVSAEANGVTLKVEITGKDKSAEAQLKKVHNKAVEFANWADEPDQTQFDFDAKAILADCTIRVDQPSKDAETFSMVIEGVNAKSKFAQLSTLFAAQQGGRKFNIKFEEIPLPKEKAAGTVASTKDGLKEIGKEIKKLTKSKLLDPVLQKEADDWLLEFEKEGGKPDLATGDDLRYRLGLCQDKKKSSAKRKAESTGAAIRA